MAEKELLGGIQNESFSLCVLLCCLLGLLSFPPTSEGSSNQYVMWLLILWIS